ncbi:MAG TPA: EamA family transporter RarD [Chthoniobacterales bacterium]|nr:EamA family transporter RarD [Chthoniobacterales bacterium]
MSISRSDSPKRHETLGLIAGIACFTTWGLIPVYWKLLVSIPATEILAHRFVWTTVFLSLVLSWQRRWSEVVSNIRSRRTLIYCLTGGLAIATNWFLFIWAVNIDRVIETSLGYFMTPLMNVLFGALFLRERLTRLQFVSVLLALLGVLNLAVGYGQFPWIAVFLCVSFGLYGLLRKKSGTTAIPGLFIETILLLPLAIVFIIYLQRSHALVFGNAGWWLSTLLVSTGVVTAVPLFWFGYAARHLRLITVGFLQYLSPIGSFFLGVFLFHEPFTRGHLVTFVLIWIALAIFTAEAVMRWRLTRVREIDSCAFEASALD